MKKYIYIFTDCNREYLYVGYTDNLLKTVSFRKELSKLAFDPSRRTSRLVYFEEFTSEEFAIERFNQIHLFTRPQKERLIRAINSNWLDLSLNLKKDRTFYNGIEKSNRMLFVS